MTSGILVCFSRESMVMVRAMRACFEDPSYSTDQSRKGRMEREEGLTNLQSLAWWCAPKAGRLHRLTHTAPPSGEHPFRHELGRHFRVDPEKLPTNSQWFQLVASGSSWCWEQHLFWVCPHPGYQSLYFASRKGEPIITFLSLISTLISSFMKDSLVVLCPFFSGLLIFYRFVEFFVKRKTSGFDHFFM